MQKLTFQIEINASPRLVYEQMLGLHDKQTYEHWTAAFNPTSTYEGDWSVGSKMQFIGVNKDGQKGGMASEIIEIIPAQQVNILHYGFIQGDDIITTGEAVEIWNGATENYYFATANGSTLVTVEIDMVDEYLDYFKEKYPEALQRLKQSCEQAF